MIKKKMMVKRIFNNPEVYYQKGAISCLKNINYNNILILVSNTIKNSEYYNKVKSYLEGKKVQDEIVPTPTQEIINNLKEKYSTIKPEVIIGIGGGKVLDCAKVLKVLMDNLNLSFSDLENTQFCDIDQTKLIAIPTTPGTGSEANSIAVIKNSEGKKIPYINQGFVPNLAILDHTFLKSIEEKALFEFAADIFAHSFEGSVSIASTTLLRAIGKSCLSLLKSGISKIKKNPNDTKALAEIQYSGYLGGIVQGNAYVGLCHALAHALEEQTPISHGGSILAVLKLTLQWMKRTKYKPEYDEFLKIYDAIGFDKYRNTEILQKLDIDQWAERALKDPSITTSPIRMKKENLLVLINWILNQK